MSASVLSFLRSRELKDRWTDQELAEFYRVVEALGRAGLDVSFEVGTTDENEPWCAFFDPATEEVLAHFARIDGQFVADGAMLRSSVRGRDLRSILERVVATSRIYLPNASQTKLYLHPAAMLTAFVATALMHLREGVEAGTTSLEVGKSDGKALEDVSDPKIAAALGTSQNEGASPSDQHATFASQTLVASIAFAIALTNPNSLPLFERSRDDRGTSRKDEAGGSIADKETSKPNDALPELKLFAAHVMSDNDLRPDADQSGFVDPTQDSILEDSAELIRNNIEVKVATSLLPSLTSLNVDQASAVPEPVFHQSESNIQAAEKELGTDNSQARDVEDLFGAFGNSSTGQKSSALVNVNRSDRESSIAEAKASAKSPPTSGFMGDEMSRHHQTNNGDVKTDWTLLDAQVLATIFAIPVPTDGKSESEGSEPAEVAQLDPVDIQTGSGSITGADQVFDIVLDGRNLDAFTDMMNYIVSGEANPTILDPSSWDQQGKSVATFGDIDPDGHTHYVIFRSSHIVDPWFELREGTVFVNASSLDSDVLLAADAPLTLTTEEGSGMSLLGVVAFGDLL